MPIIPRTSEGVRLQSSAPVQIADTRDARIPGEAISGFGRELQSFAAQQMEVDRGLKRKEFQDSLSNTLTEAKATAERSSAPDGSNYGEIMKSVAEPKVAELLNQYGSDPRLRKEMESFVGRVRGNLETDATIRQAQMLESHNYGRAEGLLNNSAARIRETTPMGEKSIDNLLTAEMQSFGEVVDAMKLSPENSEKMRKAYLETASSSFIDGLANKQRYGEALKYLQAIPSEGMSTNLDPKMARELGMIDSREEEALSKAGQTYKVPLLTDKKGRELPPGVARLMSGMPENKKAALIDQMRAKVTEQTQVRLSDLNASIRGFEKLAMDGAQYSDAQVVNLKKDILAAPGMTQTARLRAVDAVNTAHAVNSQLRVAATTPRAQWGELLSRAAERVEQAGVPGIGSDFAVRQNRTEAIQVLQSSLATLQKKQNQDPAGFMLENDPEIRLLAASVKDGQGVEAYATTLLNKQAYMGMPQAVLSKQQAYGMAQNLNALPDGMATNEYLNSLQAQYGKHMPKVMQQIAKEDEGLAPLQAVVYADPFTRAQAVDALKNSKAINQQFKLPELKLEGELVEKSVVSAMADFRTSVIGGTNDSSRLGVVQSISSMVEIQAKRDVLRGMKPEDAVKKAYGAIVDSSYAIVSGKNSSSVLVPRSLVSDAKIVQTYMNVMTPEDLNIAGANPELRNTRWVTNASQTGIRMVELMPDGSLQPVYNKQKKVVEVEFQDINLRPPKKVQEANKNLFQKMFGG